MFSYNSGKIYDIVVWLLYDIITNDCNESGVIANEML